MARAPAQPKNTGPIEVPLIQRGIVHFAVVGQDDSPHIHNCMAQKAENELLFPKGRRVGAARKGLKHNVPEEFAGSIVRTTATDKAMPKDKNGQPLTLLGIPAPAFHDAIASVAMDMPGMAKTEISRLTWVRGHTVPQWGQPHLFMDIVRTADQKKTPDVRTRTAVPEWASAFSVEFIKPKITAEGLWNLAYAAGYMQGVGDGRQGKGRLSCGRWFLVPGYDPRWITWSKDKLTKWIDEDQEGLREKFVMLYRTAGRAAQETAMADDPPAMWGPRTERLWNHFHEALAQRQSMAEGLADDPMDDLPEDLIDEEDELVE